MRLFELAGNNPHSDTAVFTFGRFNPPTIGHEALVDKVKQVAKQMDADHFVFISPTHRPPKDPLDWNTRVEIAKQAFPGANIWNDPSIKNPFEALEALGEDYKKVILVVGSDRVEKFKSGMEPYLNDFGIEDFDVISAGERDPDADGVSGMSASKARELAMNGEWEKFAASLPAGVSETDKKKAYNLIRKNI